MAAREMETQRDQRRNGPGLQAAGLLIAALMMLAFGAWIFMLLLGMFAGYMAMPGLALGYWASMGVLAMVRLVFMKAEAS